MIKTFDGFDFFLSQIKPNLKELAAFSFNYLLEHYQAIIDQAESQLIAAARDQKTDQDKARFIAAIEQCQRLKGGMVAAFGHGLMAALKPLNGHPADPQPQLSFQNSVNALASHARDDDTFMLNAATQAEQRYENLNKTISRALAKSLPGSHINTANNPFSPMIISNALFTSLQITSMHPAAKKEILALFERLLLGRLDSFYQQILQQLQAAGIGIDMPEHLADSPEDGVLEPATPELDTIESGFNTLLEDGIIPPDYHSPHYQPMALRFAGHAADKIHTVSIAAIDQLLADIQKGYDPVTDGALPAYILAHLDASTGDGKPRILCRHDENVINLISLVFDQIAATQDQRMADLFLRLKVPYTRLALTDALFFHDTGHPARILLDQLLTLSYSSHDHETLYKQLQTCAMKILLRYKGELSLFTGLVSTVKSYQESNREPFAQSLENIRQQLEAEEQKRFALAAVSELLGQKTRKLARRLRFHSLLEKIMVQVLAGILLKEGNDSKNWETGTKLLEIVLILSGSSDSRHFAALTGNLASITRTLSQFLSDHGVQAEHKRVFLDQLLEIQMLLAQGKKLTDIDDDELAHTFAVDMIIDDYKSEMMADIDTALIGSEHGKFANARALELVPAHKRPAQANVVAYVDKLRLGQWLSFIVDRERIPCSPCYFSRQKDSYVFCDRHNRRLFERKRSEIVQDMLSGFACPLASTLSFEGNLAWVVNRLANPG